MSTAGFHGTVNTGCLDLEQALSDLMTTRNGGGMGVSQIHGHPSGRNRGKEGRKDNNAVRAGVEEQSRLL